jgi:hypothetical protein
VFLNFFLSSKAEHNKLALCRYTRVERDGGEGNTLQVLMAGLHNYPTVGLGSILLALRRDVSG